MSKRAMTEAASLTGPRAHEGAGGNQTSPREYTTRTSRVWLDEEGIMWEVENPGSEHHIADARENVAANATVGQGRRPPLLVDMSQAKLIKREARAFYSREAPRVACAVALVVGSPLNRMIGNFFLGLNRPTIPVRLFSSTADAAAWLRQFLRVDQTEESERE